MRQRVSQIALNLVRNEVEAGEGVHEFPWNFAFRLSLYMSTVCLSCYFFSLSLSHIDDCMLNMYIPALCVWWFSYGWMENASIKMNLYELFNIAYSFLLWLAFNSNIIFLVLFSHSNHVHFPAKSVRRTHSSSLHLHLWQKCFHFTSSFFLLLSFISTWCYCCCFCRHCCCWLWYNMNFSKVFKMKWITIYSFQFVFSFHSFVFLHQLRISFFRPVRRHANERFCFRVNDSA